MIRTALVTLVALLAAAAPTASAAPFFSPGAASANAGGAAPYEPPTVTAIACRSQERCASATAAQPGALVRLRGRSLARASKVVFLGGPSRGDDRTSPALRPRDGQLDVRVPDGAASGRVRVLDATGLRSAPSRESLTVVDAPAPDAVAVRAPSGAPAPAPAPSAASAEDAYAFPVQGPADFGDAGNQFGSVRSGHTHQGHDLFAKCGTPLVAARGGTVRFKAWHGAAGNYLVIATDDGRDMAYMHLQTASPLGKGDAVATGQPIGAVGDSGNAHGCHLHFEIWSAPGWYRGGSPVDPLPHLRAWAADAKRK